MKNINKIKKYKMAYLVFMAVMGIASHIAIAYLYDWKLTILIFLLLWSNNASTSKILDK
jgi:hypothetical protein